MGAAGGLRMETIALKGTDIRISRLSLGTWPFSGIKLWGATDEAEAIRVIHQAMDCGINTFDTAARYGDGESERILSAALKDRRSKAVVASKVHTAFLGYQDVLDQCDATLQRLGTDYLDLYQIHWPNPQIPMEETLGAFEALQKTGKIRAFSVCNFGPKCLEQTKGHAPVLNQLPWSLVWRVIENNGTLAATEDAGIPVWTYCALGQGLLTGKYRSVEDVPLSRRANRIYSSRWGQGRHRDGGFEVGVFALLDKLRGLCEESGCTMPQLALAYLRAQRAVGSILVGARTPQQLTENLQAYETAVSADVLAQARELSAPLMLQMGTNADLFEDTNGGRMY